MGGGGGNRAPVNRHQPVTRGKYCWFSKFNLQEDICVFFMTVLSEEELGKVK